MSRLVSERSSSSSSGGGRMFALLLWLPAATTGCASQRFICKQKQIEASRSIKECLSAAALHSTIQNRDHLVMELQP